MLSQLTDECSDRLEFVNGMQRCDWKAITVIMLHDEWLKFSWRCYTRDVLYIKRIHTVCDLTVGSPADVPIGTKLIQSMRHYVVGRQTISATFVMALRKRSRGLISLDLGAASLACQSITMVHDHQRNRTDSIQYVGKMKRSIFRSTYVYCIISCVSELWSQILRY